MSQLGPSLSLQLAVHTASAMSQLAASLSLQLAVYTATTMCDTAGMLSFASSLSVVSGLHCTRHMSQVQRHYLMWAASPTQETVVLNNKTRIGARGVEAERLRQPVIKGTLAGEDISV